jgi:predicted outer membrane repeat protein
MRDAAFKQAALIFYRSYAVELGESRKMVCLAGTAHQTHHFSVHFSPNGVSPNLIGHTMNRYLYISFMLVLLLRPTSTFAAGRNNVVLDPTATIIVHNEAEFQTAIANVADGGVIELVANTYYAPPGGFNLSNISKRFTIRAAPGNPVVFHGNGHEIMKILNNTYSGNAGVIFQDLQFLNGQSAQGHIAGGITLQRANATFVRCKFESNSNSSSAAGGGGVVVNNGSIVFFIDNVWINNSAKSFGAGLVVEGDSRAYIHNSQFLQNRTNLPNHVALSHGAGIMVHNSTLRVSNTLFDSNQAGYAGGAIYALGIWRTPLSTPAAEVIIANCTFSNNASKRDPTVSSTAPTEGGAIHSEDHVTVKIYNSRFLRNSADIGGGVNVYRALGEVEGAVFVGNRAVGLGQATGFGGAINLSSNDIPADASVNRRSAALNIKDSWIQGENIAAQSSGGMALSGDSNRVYGTNGVTKLGTLSDNLANVTIDNVVFADLDVQFNPNSTGSGNGGALVAALTNLAVANGLVILSDAKGVTYSSGGGFSIIDQSTASISNSTFGRNSVDLFGAALFVQGANINATGSTFVRNEIRPGVQEPLLQSYGAAIFSSPENQKGLYVVGTLQNNILSENIGLPIWEQDNSNGPINDVRYNSNQIYSNSFSGSIYCNTIPGYCGLDVNGLNTTTVIRATTSTKKSQIANSSLSTPPVIGSLKAGPKVLTTAAPGDVVPTPGYLAYSWGGGSASLDGVAATGNAGIAAAAQVGVHTLSVSGSTFQAVISQAATPSAILSSSWNGSSYTLAWSATSGAFLDGAVDQGIAIPSLPNGSINAQLSSNMTYTYYVITKEGGAIASISTMPAQFKVFNPIIRK